MARSAAGEISPTARADTESAPDAFSLDPPIRLGVEGVA